MSIIMSVFSPVRCDVAGVVGVGGVAGMAGVANNGWMAAVVCSSGEQYTGYCQTDDTIKSIT